MKCGGKISLVGILFTLCTFGAHAQMAADLNLHLKVSGLTDSTAPQIYNNYVILSYKDPDPVRNGRIRYVGAAFRNESFGSIHTFERNDNGVYFLAYAVPRDVTVLEYRLVVDGVWISDPRNPDSVEVAGAGVRLSRVDVPEQPSVPPESPLSLPGNRVKFVLDTTPGEMVYVAGSFNNWDPFMHRMDEITPGHYVLTIRLNPGTYYYYYVYGGMHVPDPRNINSGFDAEGNRVSMFRIAMN